jgi:hypothetical protein
MEAAAPPTWVRKRDGSLAPFDGDKISRALFAASEALGRPDAFLARELADGVAHFLAAERSDDVPSTSEIGETTIKVVRELGCPALAEAFAAHGRQRVRGGTASRADGPAGELVLRFAADTPPREVQARCLEQYTLQTVFTRDLKAAHDEGLLTLTGLEAPGELAGCVLDGVAAAGRGLVEAVEAARRSAGGFAALDGPEYLLARAGRADAASARAFARDLGLGLRVAGLRAVVNLNAAEAPSAAADLAEGPLFAGRPPGPAAAEVASLADLLLEELPAAAPPGRLRIDWHLEKRDFEPGPGPRERLLRPARLALAGAPIAFVFDRPRRPPALAEGLTRRHPAVLLTVGLHLPRLARQAADVDSFLERKLPSLARLALSAGVQKRAFLRRDAALSNGFLLDRARLVVAPVGLDAAVRRLAGAGLCDGAGPVELGRRLVQRLLDVLRRDGRAAHLETCLDGPATFTLHEGADGAPADAAEAAGLSPWDEAAAVKAQCRAAGALHAAPEGGALALFPPAGRPAGPEQALEWLRTAWRTPEVSRLRFVRPNPSQRQLKLPSEPEASAREA